MNTTAIQEYKLTEEQQAENKTELEQYRYNKTVDWAEFWAGIEDMALASIIRFHKNQRKLIKRRKISNYINTNTRNGEALTETEGILAILEFEE